MLTDHAPAGLRVGLVPARRPAAAIFDFDGTLVDTGTLNTDAVRASFDDLALTVPEPWLRQAPLADLGALRARLRADLGLDLPCTDREFVARTRAHWLTGSVRARPVPPVAAAARHLAATVPIAVASANDGQVVRAGLAAVGLADVFNVVVAREHVAHLKPAPDAYLLAAARLHTDPHRCLAFENTCAGVAAAHAAGMPVIDVRQDTWTVRHP
ncbi:HAD family phosphatase [Streptomyces chumphonensis]|uniref:HAD family phosphatase n=1 Tax=Streptomyces chumphonensis TaxID=1214925 RepID=A0A927EXG6_9ACTN|nr:HAD family phosphatase [Streptomyces chumphonensis]MBD3930454.1 HAD family phosphatase [Streptomyces chumphonensis]